MSADILKLDPRGRITIGSAIRKNGVEPAKLWRIGFGTYGTVILTPLSIVEVAPDLAA